MDLAIRHATLATLAGPAGPRAADAADDVGLRRDHAVLVEDGRIAWVGPDEECPSATRTLDAGGDLVTPGYVDPHTHLVYAGDRAFELAMKLAGRPYLEILAAGGGIAHTVGATRQATRDDLVVQAQGRLRRMLRNGTTCLEAKTGYGLEIATELRQLEAAEALSAAEDVPIVHTFLGAHAIPPEHRGQGDAYVDLVVDEMLPAVGRQGLARFCDVFVEKDVFTVEQGHRILTAASRHGMQGRVHADEIVNTGGAELAAAVGALSADHLLRVSETGIEALAGAGTIATLLPTVPLTLFQPEWAPARQMLEAGVPIALATDHNPNNPATDMNLVAQLACFTMRLTPAQAITGATWNAACSLGLESEVGSIEVGKRADLVVHDVPDLDHWVYEPGRSTVHQVIRHGRMVR